MTAEPSVKPSAASGEASHVRRLKAGEDEAYATLVRLYGGRLLAVAHRYFPGSEVAQDAVQEAFLSAFQALRTLLDPDMRKGFA